MKTRRVGTVTLGLVLITFGVLFLIHLVTDLFSYLFVMKLWPLILIILGAEILVSSFHGKEDKFVYDFAAIFIIMLLTFFSMGMAGAEFIISHANYTINF